MIHQSDLNKKRASDTVSGLVEQSMTNEKYDCASTVITGTDHVQMTPTCSLSLRDVSLWENDMMESPFSKKKVSIENFYNDVNSPGRIHSALNKRCVDMMDATVSMLGCDDSVITNSLMDASLWQLARMEGSVVPEETREFFRDIKASVVKRFMPRGD